MLIKCPTCREPVSKKWLALAMPWSKYTCGKCGSVCAGTFLRLLVVSISTGVLGYVLIGVIKGKIDPILLPLPLALTLAVLFLDLPLQIKRVNMPTESTDNESA
jgi:asparagine N-glycosylation enzyme membrane subunit Stt3